MQYTIIDKLLYLRSTQGPYLQCLAHLESQYFLAEIHQGQCGNHYGKRMLMHQALSLGYYWPYVQKYVMQFV